MSKTIRASRKGVDREFRIECATVADVPRIAELQTRAAADTTSSLFVRSSVADWERLDSGAIGFRVMDGDKMAAFLMMVTDAAVIEAFLARLDPSLRSQGPTVILDTVFVDPACRGFGLQMALMEHVEQVMTSQHPIRILATVAPENRVSIRNFLTMHYAVVTAGSFYGGYHRLVFGKSIDTAANPENE